MNKKLYIEKGFLSYCTYEEFLKSNPKLLLDILQESGNGKYKIIETGLTEYPHSLCIVEELTEESFNRKMFTVDNSIPTHNIHFNLLIDGTEYVSALHIREKEAHSRKSSVDYHVGIKDLPYTTWTIGIKYPYSNHSESEVEYYGSFEVFNSHIIDSLTMFTGKKRQYKEIDI